MTSCPGLSGVTLFMSRSLRPLRSIYPNPPCGTPVGLTRWVARAPPHGFSPEGAGRRILESKGKNLCAGPRAGLGRNRQGLAAIKTIVNDSILERRRKLATSRNLRGARRGVALVVPASWTGRAGAVVHGAREHRPCRQAPGNDLNEEPGSVVYSDAVVYRGELIASRVAALALLGMSLATAGNAAQSGSGADLAAPRLIRPAPYASVSEPITFQWTEVSGAAAYGIEIRNAPANAGQVVVSEKGLYSSICG